MINKSKKKIAVAILATSLIIPLTGAGASSPKSNQTIETKTQINTENISRTSVKSISKTNSKTTPTKSAKTNNSNKKIVKSKTSKNSQKFKKAIPKSPKIKYTKKSTPVKKTAPVKKNVVKKNITKKTPTKKYVVKTPLKNTTNATPKVAPVSLTTLAPNYSKGKGGAFTNRNFVNYSTAGKSSQYHVYASGIDRTKPVGVTFQFHGDGGYEFKNPSYKLPGLNKQAKAHNMIFVSIKAPNAQNVWWQGLEGNGDYVRSLIQKEILAKYNIDKNKVWAVGYSGGAEFISYELIQEHSDLFTGGGAILFGGGGAPTGFSRTPSANFKKNFQMTWYVGKDDDLNNSDEGWSAIADATKGYNFYKARGFSNAKMITPEGIDHFEYDEPKVFGDILNARY